MERQPPPGGYLFGLPADAAIRVAVPLLTGGLSVLAFFAFINDRPRLGQATIAASTVTGAFFGFAQAMRAEGRLVARSQT